MKNKGLANKAAQNRLPGFRVLSQFFLQSISRCAILLYTDHKKHPVFLLRIVSFYRCDPRPSRGLQLVHMDEFLLINFMMRSAPLTGTATSCAFKSSFIKQPRCDPRPSRGLQLLNQPLSNHRIKRCDPRPSRGLQLLLLCTLFPFDLRCDPRPSRGQTGILSSMYSNPP